MKEKIAALRERFDEGNLLSGSAMLLVSMTIVNAGNYLFNLILGRWLGPADFADLSLIVTLLLMVTFVTVTLQLTAAKFAATYVADNTPELTRSLRRSMGRIAWGGGTVLALVLALGAPVWQSFFHTTSPWPFVILALGLPVYFAQGVDRGILQGETRFGRLAATYQAEMWARLGFGLLFVMLGWSVNGAVLGILISFYATWLVATTGIKNKVGEIMAIPSAQRTAIAIFAWPVIVANISQILINNSDILIVKRFFPAEEAGHYAALALIGRVVFFATWSVVTTLFPIVAQKHAKGESHRHLLWVGLGIVGGISTVIVIATILIPEFIVQVLFGDAYLNIAPLLWLYAIATMLYALANVVVTYRLSADNRFGPYIATLAGLTQVIGLWMFHNSLRQIVVAQIIIMGCLLGVLLLWDGWLALQQRSRGQNTPVNQPNTAHKAV